MQMKLIEGLFETDAMKVSAYDRPFWYTSGKLGPFYINTHYLYGSEKLAVNLLSIIDELYEDVKELHNRLYEAIMENYKKDKIFQNVIDSMITYIDKNIDIEQIDYISGGARRDWFFSIPVADKLGKKHVTIFKDMSMVIFEKGEISDVSDLNQAKVLHIADLITEATSYERAWIPAIKSINGTITDSLVVVDRQQGGKEKIEGYNIKSHSLCSIDKEFFTKAFEIGCITSEQCDMVKGYLQNPDAAMTKFIAEHPEFLKDELEGADKKSAERARLCIEKGFYKSKNM